MTEKNHIVYGPVTPLAREMHQMKYRQDGENFRDAMVRNAGALADNPEHFRALKPILLDQGFLAGGRVQSAMGALKTVTAYNCFVSGAIEDSMASIMQRATEAAETMRLGGGIGYDFSNIRPRGDRIKSLDSQASGPVSFMSIFDAVCQTIASSGHRRGAQMAVLRIDHPDILQFIRAKRNSDKLNGFNISVGVTDEFMDHLERGQKFPLRFDGRIYEWIDPTDLWDEIMRTNWDWAEPGVLFIDRINEENNLWYCEQIAATNPCGEQPLPPFGACLLGSWNLVKYLKPRDDGKGMGLDYRQLAEDIPHVVRAMDNVIDRTTYPLPEQEIEAKNKRRMGLGVTGLANALEACGYRYGTQAFLEAEADVLSFIAWETYNASINLAKEKGSFPLLDREKYIQSGFMQRMPAEIRDAVLKFGIRNSHLLSIAPTGTISITADNVSSGIEPPYTLEYQRTIQTFDGAKIEKVQDYGYRFLGIRGATADEVTAEQHVNVLAVAQQWVDSACSKTCNVGDQVPYDEFKGLYLQGYMDGAKGMTTFRAAGKRFGILQAQPVDEETPEEAVEACTFDPVTGDRTCD
jgi:ribonucleoside-diphosphate reductase alpha chain